MVGADGENWKDKRCTEEIRCTGAGDGRDLGLSGRERSRITANITGWMTMVASLR